MAKEHCYDHPRPAVTVDVVLFSGDRVLLIRRGSEPFAGRWALPGGFVDEMEPLEAAAKRELDEETGIAAAGLEQLAAFGEPGRDPRGHTISIAFIGNASEGAEPQGGDDADEARWHHIDDLPPLAFDHDAIIAAALQRRGEMRK